MTLRLFKTILALAVLTTFTTICNAAVVYQNGFETLPANNITTASPWTAAPDILAYRLSNSSWSTNYSAGFISYSGSCGNATCKALGISHNNYPGTTTYTLTFTVNSGYAINISDLSFWNRESGTGPTTCDITINGTAAVSNLALAGTVGNNTGTLTPINSFTNLTGTVTVVMTLSGATSAPGTFRLDDFIINGSTASTQGINDYDITGGGGYCTGTAGAAIGLAGSDTGVTYQLQNTGNINVGTPVAGTGAAITFGLQPVGVYTVLATKNTTLATSVMPDTVIIFTTPLPVINIANPPAQCGGFVTLDAANAGSTYLWSDNSTAQTDAIGSSGNVTITVTDTNNCSASASVSVTINTPPSIYFNISNANICAGAQTTITANGALTYLWSNSLTTTSITVQPWSNATYDVTGTDANTCTATGTASVNVAPPIADTVTTQICHGIAYYGHTTAGTYIDTFTVAGGCDSIRTLVLTVSPPITTSVSQTICAGQSFGGHNATGNYSDTLSSLATGCDSIVALQLTVTPAITSSVTQTLCAGGSYNGHTATGSFSDTLQNAAGCDSIVNLTLTVLSPITTALTYAICQHDTFMGHTTSGTYTDTLVAANACDSIVYLQLTVNPLPHVTLFLTFDTVCSNGAQIIMSGGSPAGGWYSGQGILQDSIFNPATAPLGKDTIYYNYVDSNHCYKARYEFAHTVDCDTTVGIDEPVQGLFSVMPNPTHDILTIENTTLSGTCIVNLFDMVGRLVLTQPLDNAIVSNKTTLQLHQLPAGVYVLNIVQGNSKVFNTKVLKD